MEMKQQNTAAADSTQHCEQTTDVQTDARKFSPSSEHSLNNSSTSELPDGGEEFPPKEAKSTTSGNGSDDSKTDLADSYLRRRMKNNESARKSREKRRQIDEELRRQLDMVIAENQKLRSQLELMSMMCRQKSGGNGDVGSSDDVDFPHKLVTSSTTYQSSSTPPLFGADPHVTSAGCGITEADCSWSLTGKNRPPTVADIIRKRRPAGAQRFFGMRPSVRKTKSNASALVSTTTPPTAPLPVRQNPVANTLLLGGNGLSRTAAIPLVIIAPVELQVGLPKQRLSEPTSTVSFGAGTPYTSSGCQVDNSSALPLDLSQGVDSSSVMDRKYTVDCRKRPFHIQDFTGRDYNSSETVARTAQCQYR